jgi:hypothetical protein
MSSFCILGCSCILFHLGDEKFARKKFAQEFWIGFHQWMMGFLQKEKTRIVDCVCVRFLASAVGRVR